MSHNQININSLRVLNDIFINGKKYNNISEVYKSGITNDLISSKKINILLIGNTHGNENAGAQSLWLNKTRIYKLVDKNKFNIICIPFLIPESFINNVRHTRIDGKKIKINRNYGRINPYFWNKKVIRKKKFIEKIITNSFKIIVIDSHGSLAKNGVRYVTKKGIGNTFIGTGEFIPEINSIIIKNLNKKLFNEYKNKNFYFTEYNSKKSIKGSLREFCKQNPNTSNINYILIEQSRSINVNMNIRIFSFITNILLKELTLLNIDISKMVFKREKYTDNMIQEYYNKLDVFYKNGEAGDMEEAGDNEKECTC